MTQVEATMICARIDVDACVGCAACVNSCPQNIIALHGKAELTDPSSCIACGSCVNACPMDAISL